MTPTKINVMNDIYSPFPTIRPAIQAGRFYEADATLLSHEVDSLLARQAIQGEYRNVAALIVPHAGYYFSGNVAATAFATLDPKRHFKRVFLIGPSHYEWLDGASVNTADDAYETPLGRVWVDRETGRSLCDADSVFAYNPKAHDREHCLEVQLPFLQRQMAEVPPIVPIIVSTNSEAKLRRIAYALQPYFNDDNLFVISSDFSHYPSYKDAVEVDSRTRKAIESRDVEQFISVLERNARSGKHNLATSACGEYAIITLMLMMGRNEVVDHLLYQNSGDVEHGDKNRVVGYHAFAIYRNKPAKGDVRHDTDFFLTDEEKNMLKAIAWQSLRSAFRNGNTSSDVSFPDFAASDVTSPNPSWEEGGSNPHTQQSPGGNGISNPHTQQSPLLSGGDGGGPASQIISSRLRERCGGSNPHTQQSPGGNGGSNPHTQQSPGGNGMSNPHTQQSPLLPGGDGGGPASQIISSRLRERCGAFVTLTKRGQLRGCIGHFGEDTPLYEMVYRMARAAAFEDPRFHELREEELDDIDIEISVLTPMRRIYSLDEFELHRHGLYIRKGYRSGTFLPQVADEVNWTKEEFVGHCSRDKAGLGWDGWRDAELYVYEAIVF